MWENSLELGKSKAITLLKPKTQCSDIEYNMNL